MTSEAPLPLVSVCLPTYNRANKLKRAVDALCGGTYSNLEIIISDNASTDDTETVCRDLSASDPRIHYFRHEANQGPTRNFEFARAQVSGKYFLWHGDDDYLECNYISTCVNLLEGDSTLVLASGLAAYKEGDGPIVRYGNVMQPSSSIGLMRIINYVWNVEENSIFCGAYRVSEVRDLSMPNILAGDWAWMCTVLQRGRAVVVPSTHVFREYTDTTSSSVARICKTLGIPYRGRLSTFVISHNCAIQTASRIRKSTRYSWLLRPLYYSTILLTMLMKFYVGSKLRGVMQRYFQQSSAAVVEKAG